MAPVPAIRGKKDQGDAPFTTESALRFMFPEWIIEEGLTIKEAIFADRYSLSLDPVDAYRGAMSGSEGAPPDEDDTTPEQKVEIEKAAERFLRRRNLSRVLGRLIQERTGIPTLLLIDKLAGHAYTTLPDLFDDFDNGKLKPFAQMTRREKAAIKSIKWDKDTGLPEVKVYDAVEALRDLIRVQGLFRDTITVTGKDGGPVKVVLSKEDQAVL